MLQSYLNDWANARKKAVILEEQKNEAGEVVFQRAEVVFQGVKIEIRNKRVVGAPEGKPQFCAEFFVPSTITLIDAFRNSEFPNTEFIATLLEAIDPNYESNRKDALAKRRDSADQYMTEKKQEWTTELDESIYSPEQKSFILDFATSLLKRERLEGISKFIQTMVRYQDNILDNAVATTTYDGRDITGMDILYDLLCRCCSRRALAESGKYIVTAKGAEYVFLDDSHDDRLSNFNRNALNILRAIYSDCNNSPSIFTTVAYGISSFYAYKFSEPIAYRLAKVNDRRGRKTRRADVVTVDAMMNNIADVFENAKPLKTKKGKKG